MALQRVVELVLDEDDGVVVPDRALQQALRVVRRRGDRHLQPRDVADPRLQALAVLRGGAARRSERRAHDERHLQLAARHVVDLRRLVAELVHDERQKVAEHDVDDGAQARHRSADTEPRDAGLRDRRVEHALRSELLDETREHLERRSGLRDVLADDEDGRVAAQLFRERLVDRLPEAQLPRLDAKNSHQNDPSVAGARCPARSCVLSRANSAAIGAPCVLVSHAASALRRRRTILKRVLSVDIVRHFARVGERRVERGREAALDLAAHLVLDRLQTVRVRDAGLEEPRAEARDRVALVAPQLLLVLRPVVRAVDVADVMAVVAVRIAQQEGRPVAVTRAFDESLRQRVDGAYVLRVNVGGVDPERARPLEYIACGRLEVMRVLVVEVVLADVDHGQLPQRCHVHDLVEEALTERALAEEADRNLIGAAVLRGEGGAGRDPGRAADDRVRAQVAVGVVGDVHRAALALAVAGLLAEQLGEHAVDVRALREAVPVAAVRRRDVVVLPQRRADADRDALLAAIEVREPGHLRASIQLVDLLLEQADLRHLPVHLEPRAVRHLLGRQRHGLGHGATSVSMPAMRASTSNTTAKSFSSRPIPRAAVNSSFVIAVVGSGTSSSRPSSRARFRSFCIMLTSNHASSGCSRTNGPRYATIGDAITLASMTSTAVSREMP